MKQYYKSHIPYLFLMPAFVVLSFFFFIPFFESFLLSFQSYKESIYNPSWVGLGNYIELFNTPVFYKTLANTFIYLFVATPILVVLPLVIAIFLNQKIKGISIYRTLIYIPVVVSLVVAGIAWKWVYAPEGILNYILSLFNLGSVNWLTSPDVALFSVIAVTVWKGLGYYMVIYLAALMSVSSELYESCELDGANAVQKHLAVTIPHIKPTIALVSIISAISAMKVFVEIYVMTQGGPLNSSKTIVYYIYERAFEHLDLGFASSAGIVLLAIVMVLSILNMKYFKQESVYEN